MQLDMDMGGITHQYLHKKLVLFWRLFKPFCLLQKLASPHKLYKHESMKVLVHLYTFCLQITFFFRAYISRSGQRRTLGSHQ